MVTKNLIFRGDVGKAYTVDLESLDGQTSVQAGISSTELQDGTYTTPISSVVATDLTTYVAKINLGGSLALYYGADLKEVAGTYYATELPTPLMNATVSSGGGGANTVTIVVEDENGDPLQNATVTAKLNGSISDTGSTDVDGEYLLHLDDGTYSLAITCAGYTGAGSTLVVNGDETPVPFQLTALTITPSDPPFVTGYLVVRTGGNPDPGVVVSVAMKEVATGETGSAYKDDPITVVSDASGIATFTNLSAGAVYQIRFDEDGEEWTGEFTAGNTTFEIKSFVG